MIRRPIVSQDPDQIMREMDAQIMKINERDSSAALKSNSRMTSELQKLRFAVPR